MQGFAAYWTAVSRSAEWYRILNVSGKTIYHDNNKSTAYNRICKENISNSLKVYVVAMTVLLSSFFLATLNLAYNNYRDGTKSTLYELRLPYFNKDPDTEFILQIAWELICDCMGAFGILLMEAVLAIINNTIAASVELCALELSRLSIYLEEKNGIDKQSNRMLKIIFMKISYMDE